MSPISTLFRFTIYMLENVGKGTRFGENILLLVMIF